MEASSHYSSHEDSSESYNSFEASLRRPRRESSLLVIILSWIITLTSGSLIGITSMHWGGAYWGDFFSEARYVPLEFYLFPVGILLWTCVGVLAGVSLLKQEPLGDWVDATVLLWLSYATWSYFNAPIEFVARIELLWIFNYGGMFLALRHGLHSRTMALGLVTFILALALGSCAFGLYHKGNFVYEIWGQMRPNYGARISGTFGSPNNFSNFCVMGMLGALSLGSYSRLSWVLRIVLFWFALVLTVGVFYSVSRGGYLAWAAGFGVLAWFLFCSGLLTWWMRWGAILAVIVGIFFGITCNEFVIDRIQKTQQGDIRIQLLRDGLKMWKTDPVTGTGMASYDYLQRRMRGPDTEPIAVYAHNDYLNLLIDYGVIGAAIVGAFLVGVIIYFFRGDVHDMSERELLLRRLGGAVLGAMLVHSFVDFNMHIPACAMAFFAFIAMGMMKLPRERRQMKLEMDAVGERPLLPFSPYAPFYLLFALVLPFLIIPLTTKSIQGMALLAETDNQLQRMTTRQVENIAAEARQIDPQSIVVMNRLGDLMRVKVAGLQAKIRARLARPNLKADDAVLANLYEKRQHSGTLAMQYYEEALEANPLDDRIRVKKALVLDLLGRYPEAYFLYTDAISKQPYNRFFEYSFAFHLIKRGKLDEAELILRKAVGHKLARSEDPTILLSAREALQAIRDIRAAKR